MVGLGIVLLVEQRTGSYGLAGTVSAVFVLAEAAFAVLHGRWVDHFGQSRVLPIAISVFGGRPRADDDRRRAGLGARPRPTSSPPSSGAALPQVGASVRTRWSHLLDEPAEKQTAYALEAVLDEVVFVVGPVLVTLLATSWHPVAGLTFALVTRRRRHLRLRRPAQHRAAGGPRSAPTASAPPMPWRLVLPLALVCLTLGCALRCRRGHRRSPSPRSRATRWAAGWLLAAWSFGSLVAGLVTGADRLAHAGRRTACAGALPPWRSPMVPLMFIRLGPADGGRAARRRARRSPRP